MLFSGNENVGMGIVPEESVRAQRGRRLSNGQKRVKMR
jgi:hypothetical protein